MSCSFPISTDKWPHQSLYQSLIYRREKVYESFLSFLEDYRVIYANEAQSGHNDPLIKILDLPKVKLENLRGKTLFQSSDRGFIVNIF